jgi:deoxyhypusine synthase
MATTREFIHRHFLHFNAAALKDAANGWYRHLARDGRMVLTLGGAMSTAELGISIAELIRRDCVHAVCCTGANLEEDLFNLVAHDQYMRIPDYRDLTPEEEADLLHRKLNRVTDTCIPEEHAINVIDKLLLPLWQAAETSGTSDLPHQYLYELVHSGALEDKFQIDPRDSWVVAAAEVDLPVWTPGWEDSTLGNLYTAHVLKGDLSGFSSVVAGPAAMVPVIEWYREASSAGFGPGFFQIGGGISGDFPIAVVPLMRQDLKEDVPLWGYFCQISEATTSYGSYSGAVPNEKITWEKLGVETPSFVIESDATICFPLIAQYVLDALA